MKNKSTGTGDTRKKGFYVALSAGAGAVLVLALVISFNNLTTTTPDTHQMVYEPADDEFVMAGADYTLPYLAQAPSNRSMTPDRPAVPNHQPAPEGQAAPDQSDQALFRPRSTPGLEEPSNAAPQEPAPSPGPDTAPSAADGENVPDAAPEATPDGQPTRDTEAAANQEVLVFDAFTEDDRLMWPVYGDIAMIFSQDRLIYNPTLDQWRTNDDLRISAQEGTPVRAAAAGKVVEVGEDRVYGNFVRIYNGNDWETIYGQLMDGILVAEGDIVQAGQVIGGVGRPSVFSVLNGHHVSLRVLHEDNLVDPKLLLSDVQE